MGAPRLNPLKTVTFLCSGMDCPTKFEAIPETVEPDESQDWHPWRYTAHCPQCGQVAEQAYWEKALLKAWAKSTGPKTAEGLAKAAANLEGHPTAAEAQLTRFNAIKHGLYTTATKYFPARPGKYQACEGCRYLDNGCGEISKACLQRVEIYMVHQLAYDENNPKLLAQLNMEMQATVRAIVNEILLSIARRGVEWETPEWYYDKDGRFHLAKYTPEDGGQPIQIMKVQEHPLLKTLIDLMKSNGMTLPDDGMTLRSAEQEQQMKGFLASRAGDQEQLMDFQQRQTVALEKLSGLIDRSKQRLQGDPVLAEYRDVEKPMLPAPKSAG